MNDSSSDTFVLHTNSRDKRMHCSRCLPWTCLWHTSSSLHGTYSTANPLTWTWQSWGDSQFCLVGWVTMIWPAHLWYHFYRSNHYCHPVYIFDQKITNTRYTAEFQYSSFQDDLWKDRNRRPCESVRHQNKFLIKLI